MKQRRPHHDSAFVSLDVLGGVVITLATLFVFWFAADQVARTRDDADTRRALRQVAEFELSRIRAGLLAPPAVGETVERRTEAATLRMSAAVGSDEWCGFTCVRVVASQNVRGRPIHVELATYVHAPEGSP